MRDLAEEFRDADVRDLFEQGRAFARQRPKLVTAGVVAAGVIAIGLARGALAGRVNVRAARAA